MPDIERSSDALLATLRDWQAKLDAMPPAPHAFMAHHSVPYSRVFRQWDSRVFRQWDTRGRLLVWVNRGLIADLPRARPDERPPGLSMQALHFGTPVINA